jgi:predicted 3-demethylubiquinone-9 3-methyltransferase (glyoxalase superfamily)
MGGRPPPAASRVLTGPPLPKWARGLCSFHVEERSPAPTYQQKGAHPMATRQKISPFLYFNDQAEEAANFYVSLFPNSKVKEVVRMQGIPEVAPGKASIVTFELDGMEVIALNGGPAFTFTEAFSMLVHCDTQEEVDHLWDRLTADGGSPSRCGWLKDRWGLSWQIIPDVLIKLMSDKDRTRAKRVADAMMKMSKIDIAAIKRAHEG